MSLLLQLLAQFLRCLALLCRKDGLKAVGAQNLLLTQQLIVLNPGRKRAPSASALHGICLAFFAMFLSVRRLRQSAVVFRPSTLLRFRDFLTKQKYRFLFSPKKRGKSGPKGPSPEIIEAVVEFKRRNPGCACPRIAQQISDTFSIDLHPDVVRRILIYHFKPGIDSDGPSWLTFLRNSKDSLWSMDFFTTESVLIKSYSVMVMDQFSRRFVEFAVHREQVNGEALCRTFREIVSDIPRSTNLCMDNDRLYLFEGWTPLLDAFSINPIRSIPLIPVSHPFVERLIGSVRREYLDQLFFWNSR